MKRAATHRGVAGFTLVELMVVIAIATILTVIAVPSYMSHIRKTRRTEAKTALLDLAAREERLMSTAGNYSATASNLGYSGTFPQVVGSGYYSVNITNVAAAVAPTQTTAGSSATFTVTATATGAQASDTQCATFSIDQAGNQTATNATCW